MMGTGMAVTAAVAYLCYLGMQPGGVIYGLLGKSEVIMMVIIIGLPIAQLIVCGVLSARLAHLSYETARALFLAYCILTGMTFSILPYVYGEENMFIAFLFASVLFFSCTAIGYTTKIDLDQYGKLALAGLFTLIIITLVGYWIDLSFMDLTVCYVGIGIFLILTAWDMQKVRRAYEALADNPVLRAKYSIFSAFQLYLDFVNLFLYVMRILVGGKRR